MYVELKAALKAAVLDPPLAFGIVKDGVSLRLSPPPRSRTLIGTHHKVLTVYMARVFRAYAFITGQSFCRATRSPVEYDKNVILNGHSTFDFQSVTRPFRGIHIRRDPRDLLVSCVHYHLKSSELWLHREGHWGLEGSTYQHELRALRNMEERLIFELDHEGGAIIDGMSSWDYSKPEFVELRYERIVATDGIAYVRESLDQSALFDLREIMLLEKLFNIFSTLGVLANRQHIRNAKPSQWKEYFTPKVEKRFAERFGPALARLGYR